MKDRIFGNLRTDLCCDQNLIKAAILDIPETANIT